MKHAIITGGSSGIGAAIAAELVAKGYSVSLIARSEAALRETAGEITRSQPGAIVSTFPCDVRDEPALSAAMEDAQSQAGPCDMLVTSAGIARPGYFAELDAAQFRDQMDVNYFGTVHAVRAVYPAMASRGSGKIVMISSAAALVGLFGYTAYAASKFAVRGFAEALRGEAKQQGIQVSICYPPDTDTPQLAAEQAFKPAETKAITASAGVWTAEAVAKCVLAGTERGSFAIYPGLRVGLLGRAGSLIQPGLDYYFDRLARQARRRNRPT